MSEKRQQTSQGSDFLKQGSILAMASLIVRFIGMIYRIPMSNILGEEGNGIYAVAVDVYDIVLIVSSYSIPLALSKIIAAPEYTKAIQKYRENFPADPFICRGFRWGIRHPFVCRFRIYRDAYLSGLRRSEISTSYIGTDDIYRCPFGSVPWFLPGKENDDSDGGVAGRRADCQCYCECSRCLLPYEMERRQSV